MGKAEAEALIDFGDASGFRLEENAEVSWTVHVRVAASPTLLSDLVRMTLVGEGIDLTESDECLVTVVTPDHLEDAHSRVILVLGDSAGGDVEVIVDQQRSEPRPLRAEHLRDFVIDLGHRVPLPRLQESATQAIVRVDDETRPRP